MSIICPICQEILEDEELKDGRCPVCGFDFAEDFTDEESTFMFDQSGLPLWSGL